MFSSDKNVETISQLVELTRHYIGLQGEYLRLDVIDKVVRLLTALIMAGILFLFILITLIYLSFAAAYGLSAIVSLPVAFAIIGGVYLLAIMIIVINRKRWIERPLVRFLASLLMTP
ncbi:MAG: phage holin family protein [Prevotella sp.]|nr:phage holin family protein [Prevotella sp.]